MKKVSRDTGSLKAVKKLSKEKEEANNIKAKITQYRGRRKENGR